MKYPGLIPKQLCKQLIDVEIKLELNEDGYSDKLVYNNIFCNYQSKSKTEMKPNRETVIITGKCYIPNDPFTDVENLRGGKVTLNGQVYEIYTGTKARNPDQTVNYVILELI